MRLGLVSSWNGLEGGRVRTCTMVWRQTGKIRQILCNRALGDPNGRLITRSRNSRNDAYQDSEKASDLAAHQITKLLLVSLQTGLLK